MFVQKEKIALEEPLSSRTKYTYCITDRKRVEEIQSARTTQGTQFRVSSHLPINKDGKEGDEDKITKSALDEQEEEEEELCIICFSEPSCCVFLDCGHGSICLNCAMDAMKKNNICILCRQIVAQIIELESKELPGGFYKVANSYYVSREEYSE